MRTTEYSPYTLTWGIVEDVSLTVYLPSLYRNGVWRDPQTFKGRLKLTRLKNGQISVRQYGRPGTFRFPSFYKVYAEHGDGQLTGTLEQFWKGFCS